MTQTDDKTPTADDHSDAAAAVQAGSDEKEDNSGCLVLFLAMIVIDAAGTFAPCAGPYMPVVVVLGVVGFICGATVYSSPRQSMVLMESDSLTGGDMLSGFQLPLRELFAEMEDD